MVRVGKLDFEDVSVPGGVRDELLAHFQGPVENTPEIVRCTFRGEPDPPHAVTIEVQTDQRTVETTFLMEELAVTHAVTADAILRGVLGK